MLAMEYLRKAHLPISAPTGKWGIARRQLLSHHSDFTFDPEGQGAGARHFMQKFYILSYLLKTNLLLNSVKHTIQISKSSLPAYIIFLFSLIIFFYLFQSRLQNLFFVRFWNDNNAVCISNNDISWTNTYSTT